MPTKIYTLATDIYLDTFTHYKRKKKTNLKKRLFIKAGRDQHGEKESAKAIIWFYDNFLLLFSVYFLYLFEFFFSSHIKAEPVIVCSFMRRIP